MPSPRRSEVLLILAAAVFAACTSAPTEPDPPEAPAAPETAPAGSEKSVCTEPPVADPGGPYESGTYYENNTIRLDGSSSYSPCGNELAFYWDLGAPDAEIESGGPKPIVRYWTAGEYTISLVVADMATDLRSDTATTTISVVDDRPADVGARLDYERVPIWTPFDIETSAGNAGPAVARDMKFEIALPREVRILSLSAPGESCPLTSPSYVLCEFGDVPAGTVFDVVATVVLTADPTPFDLDAFVWAWSETWENHTSDNNVIEFEIQFDPGPPAFACTTIDFDGLGSHGEVIAGFDLAGQPIAVTADPHGSESLPAAVLYDTDTPAGPDPDLEVSGDCPDCAGAGNVLVISGNPFDRFGDSGTGGAVVMRGFGGAGWFLRSFTAIDSDEEEHPWRVSVDGAETGVTWPDADGSTQLVPLLQTPIADVLRIELIEESGGIDELVFCR